MGYCVDAQISVVIPAEKVEGAIEALKKLMRRVKGHGSGGSWEGGVQKEAWFSWVGTKEVLERLEEEDLVGALDEWRYVASSQRLSDLEKLSHPDGPAFSAVVVEYFEGEKWGDDEQLWAALAPFVAEGSDIVWRGEDDHHWRYVFEGGRLIEQHGEIVWR